MGEPSDSGGGNESNNEPQGTVFGVDGVSKTGSTSQDQQIGYTDGQGGKAATMMLFRVPRVSRLLRL